MIKSFLVLIVLFISAEPAAQNPNQKTWCNPMDIGYRYNWEQINDKIWEAVERGEAPEEEKGMEGEKENVEE